MAFEQRDNSGSVFVNDRKEKDSHPDRTGSAMIDGVQYWVSGWIKSGAKGQFLSLAFKKKEKQQAAQRVEGGGSARIQDDMNDDIPFAPEFR